MPNATPDGSRWVPDGSRWVSNMFASATQTPCIGGLTQCEAQTQMGLHSGGI